MGQSCLSGTKRTEQGGGGGGGRNSYLDHTLVPERPWVLEKLKQGITQASTEKYKIESSDMWLRTLSYSVI